MINYQVICSLALGIYFAMAIRMLSLYIKLLFLLVFQFFFNLPKKNRTSLHYFAFKKIKQWELYGINI